MSDDVIRTQVALIGAGPIGLELAVALKHMGVDYLHFDAGQVGQTVSWYPHQTRFFSSPERIAIAGVPLVTVDQSKATREEYLAYLRGIVEQFDLQIRTYERVERLERHDGGFLLHTRRHGQGHTYAAKQVVLAIGDMHRPRRLNIPGEDLEHVSHYFDEPHRYFRQRLLIVGGRNSAAEAALRCHRAGAQVALSYRRPAFDNKSIKYWILPELESLIRHKHIGFFPCTVPQRITPTHVTLGPSDQEGCPASADPVDVPADFVLLLTGYVMDSSLLEQVGVELVGENRQPKLDPQTMQTNVPGLFVAGTAAGGTQVRFRLFIENCHPHVTRIIKAITGHTPPTHLVNQTATRFELPEA
ncbi:MAG TPA: NAD(P)-binding domain-containing protein [Phycisphaeraceae bacterium]